MLLSGCANCQAKNGDAAWLAGLASMNLRWLLSMLKSKVRLLRRDEKQSLSKGTWSFFGAS